MPDNPLSLPEPKPIQTISDEEWSGLRDRALKANPERGTYFSAAALEFRKRGADNYRNRRSC